MDLELSQDAGERTAPHALADAALRQSVDFTEGDFSTDSQEYQPPGQDEFGRPILANVYCDPIRHTVTLLLDEWTANYAIYAIRVLAADAEARAREVRLVGMAMPADSYGAANRHAIAVRNERIARRARVLERNYRDVIEMPLEELRRATRSGRSARRHRSVNGFNGHETGDSRSWP